MGVVILYFVALFFSILLHEVGHAVAIMIAGTASIFAGIVNIFPIDCRIKGLESDGVVLKKLYKHWRKESNHKKRSKR